MKNTFLAVIAGVALMACSPSTEPAPATPVEPASTPAPMPDPAPPAAPVVADTCNMAQYASLLGKPATDPGVPAAGPTVRIIKPGDQVTMDFSEARLNIDVDAAGNITGMRCG